MLTINAGYYFQYMSQLQLLELCPMYHLPCVGRMCRLFPMFHLRPVTANWFVVQPSSLSVLQHIGQNTKWNYFTHVMWHTECHLFILTSQRKSLQSFRCGSVQIQLVQSLEKKLGNLWDVASILLLTFIQINWLSAHKEHTVCAEVLD